MVDLFNMFYFVLNALIGLFVTLKLTGFSSYGFVAGIYAIGATYLEMFLNMCYKTFYWFFELFDERIVPNIDQGLSKARVIENSPDRVFKAKTHRIDSSFEEPYESLRKGYKNGSNQTDDSTWSNKSLMQYGIYVAVGLCVVIADYYCYSNRDTISTYLPGGNKKKGLGRNRVMERILVKGKKLQQQKNQKKTTSMI